MFYLWVYQQKVCLSLQSVVLCKSREKVFLCLIPKKIATSFPFVTETFHNLRRRPSNGNFSFQITKHSWSAKQILLVRVWISFPRKRLLSLLKIVKLYVKKCIDDDTAKEQRKMKTRIEQISAEKAVWRVNRNLKSWTVQPLKLSGAIEKKPEYLSKSVWGAWNLIKRFNVQHAFEHDKTRSEGKISCFPVHSAEMEIKKSQYFPSVHEKAKKKYFLLFSI